jgi:hypothetical protein
LVVLLEPKSFSITPDGQGVFRPLDHDIHVDLSAMSAPLEPGQTYYVFYKAHADHLPAWFTVYSTFSPLQHGPGMDVRIMRLQAEQSSDSDFPQLIPVERFG